MKKIRNSKRGFTLTEILLVTGIIVLVSAAAFVGVAVTLNRARDASDDARNHADNFELEARSWIETITPNKADFASQSYYEPESESSESETESETSESTTESTVDGFVATNTPKPTPTNTPTPTPTKAPTNTPKPSGTIKTEGHVTANMVEKYTHNRGVVTLSGSGNTQTLTLQSADGWYDPNAKFTITKTNTGYTLTVPQHDFRYQMDQNLFKELYKTYTYKDLNQDQINYLRDTWGITLD